MTRLESDLKVWLAIATSSLHCGNKVGAARLHALQMMIDTRRGSNRWEDWKEAENNFLQTLSYICEFGKENGTAHETNIFIHIMIDMMTTELNNLPTEPPRRLVGYAAPYHEPVGDVYPTEDSSEWISPLPPLGEIPF